MIARAYTRGKMCQETVDGYSCSHFSDDDDDVG